MKDEYALLRARELANTVRFSEDLHGGHTHALECDLREIMDNFYRYGIEVSERLTPSLEEALTRVCSRLRVNRSCVGVFVTNTHEFQASCYFADSLKCTIGLSSALVNHLDIGEVEFVLGHEIGHFLLQHTPFEKSHKTVEFFLFERAKEISVDRIGLFACGRRDTALGALIKTASGLKSDLIKIDTKYYLNQITKISSETSGENPLSTHPSILIRVAALNSFAEGREELTYDDLVGGEVTRRDMEIKRYLDEYVDKDVQARIRQAKADLELWIAAQIVTDDDRFDREEQDRFAKRFGNETMEKLKAFLHDVPSQQVKGNVGSKLEYAKEKLYMLAPYDGENFLVQTVRDLTTHFRGR